MITLTRTDNAGPGSSPAGLHLGSGFSDRAVGQLPLLAGCGVTDVSHASYRDRAEFSTVQEEIANLKDILSKYISGRRKRRRESGR
jgi:hypothetical protein